MKEDRLNELRILVEQEGSMRMNEPTLIPLKVLVERTVRPLQASASYKQRIREELLAHVLGIFHEESANLRDERAALERTAQRFGNAGNLTRQLQQAVPRGDALRRLGESLFGFGPSQSTWRRSLRHAFSGFIHCALAHGLLAILTLVFLQERLRGNAGLTLFLFLTSVCTFSAGLLFLSHWMARALFSEAGGSWRSAVSIGAASGLLLPILIFGVCICVSGDAGKSLCDALPFGALYTLLNFVLAPLIVIAMAWRLSLEIRAHDEWANLSIE